MNKASLRVVDQVQKKWPHLGTNHFGENFVGRGEEGDQMPFSDRKYGRRTLNAVVGSSPIEISPTKPIV